MIIDDRDGSRELALVYPLTEMACLSRLEYGDVAITGNGPDDATIAVGVEVKQVSDLMQSLANGRLRDQIEGMVHSYDQSWLLTYGGYQARSMDGALQTMRGQRWHLEYQAQRVLPIGYVEGALFTYTAAGCFHKHVADETQAVWWLACLEKWWDKPWDEHRAFHKFNKSGSKGIIPDIDAETLQRMKVAAQLPGVGWERALAAAVSFGSVREMVNASAREWEDVPGVGPVIAKSIVKAVS